MEVPWDMSCYDEGPYPKHSGISFKVWMKIQKLWFHDKFVELEQRIIEEG